MSTRRDDPYHDRKTVHRAKAVNQFGGVSAACYKRPRTISLRIASWTFVSQLVTCPRCKRLAEPEVTP